METPMPWPRSRFSSAPLGMFEVAPFAIPAAWILKRMSLGMAFAVGTYVPTEGLRDRV